MVRHAVLPVVPAGWLGPPSARSGLASGACFFFAVVALIGSQVQTKEQVVVAMALVGVAQAIPTALAYPLFTELVARATPG